MERKKIITSSAVIVLVSLLIILANRYRNQKMLNYSGLETICFDRDILPIFTRNCGVSGCHNPQSSSANYVLTNYSSILKGVTAFDPYKSIVYQSIIGEGASSMPPGITLTEREKMLIRVWIGQGAKNTTCPTTISPTEKTFQPNVSK
jgi:hypothetical protein